jgi:hypothetical protein
MGLVLTAVWVSTVLDMCHAYDVPYQYVLKRMVTKRRLLISHSDKKRVECDSTKLNSILSHSELSSMVKSPWQSLVCHLAS